MKIIINEEQLKLIIRENNILENENNKILYVLVGPPAIGKSTWIKQNLNDKNPYIISRDDIVDDVAEKYGFTYDDMFASPKETEEIGTINEKYGEVIPAPPYIKFTKTVYSKILDANNEVQKLFNERINNAKNHDIIVVDMTNMSKFVRKNALNMVDSSYKKVAIVFNFKGGEDSIKFMNKKRSDELKKIGKSKTIPDHVYDSMFSRFEDVTKEEGFDDIEYIDNIKIFKNLK